jgi:hypothetical protein
MTDDIIRDPIKLYRRNIFGKNVCQPGVALTATLSWRPSGRRYTVPDIRRCESSGGAEGFEPLWSLYHIGDTGTRGPSCEPEKFIKLLVIIDKKLVRIIA